MNSSSFIFIVLGDGAGISYPFLELKIWGNKDTMFKNLMSNIWVKICGLAYKRGVVWWVVAMEGVPGVGDEGRQSGGGGC